MPAHLLSEPSDLPCAVAAQRLGIGAGSPHQGRLLAAAPWVARWRALSRGAEVAIAWDGSEEAGMALWVATRLGLAVTVVSATPLPLGLWRELDDQSVAYGGALRWARETPAGRPLVRPAA